MGLFFSFIICIMAVVIASVGREKSRQVKVKRLIFTEDIPGEEEVPDATVAAPAEEPENIPGPGLAWQGSGQAAPAADRDSLRTQIRNGSSMEGSSSNCTAPSPDSCDRTSGDDEFRVSFDNKELQKMIVYSEILKPKFDQ